MKSSQLSILATVLFAFVPIAAFAQDSQVNVQNNSNSAAAVGTGNLIIQDTTQVSDQTQLGIGGYDTPDAQLSIQDNSNEAAAIGHGNTIVQDVDQYNGQTQVDVGGYLPHGYGY
jgi:glycerate kinase